MSSSASGKTPVKQSPSHKLSPINKHTFRRFDKECDVRTVYLGDWGVATTNYLVQWRH